MKLYSLTEILKKKKKTTTTTKSRLFKKTIFVTGCFCVFVVCLFICANATPFCGE